MGGCRMNTKGSLILLELCTLYFAFQYAAVFDPAAGFQARRLLVVTDGWWMVVVDGGGGWWMVVVVVDGGGGGWWWMVVEGGGWWWHSHVTEGRTYALSAPYLFTVLFLCVFTLLRSKRKKTVMSHRPGCTTPGVLFPSETRPEQSNTTCSNTCNKSHSS